MNSSRHVGAFIFSTFFFFRLPKFCTGETVFDAEFRPAGFFRGKTSARVPRNKRRYGQSARCLLLRFTSSSYAARRRLGIRNTMSKPTGRRSALRLSARVNAVRAALTFIGFRRTSARSLIGVFRQLRGRGTPRASRSRVPSERAATPQFALDNSDFNDSLHSL